MLLFIFMAVRYIMIVHQGLYRRVYSRATVGVMVGVIWIFSYVILMPTLFAKWGNQINS